MGKESEFGNYPFRENICVFCVNRLVVIDIYEFQLTQIVLIYLCFICVSCAKTGLFYTDPHKLAQT